MGQRLAVAAPLRPVVVALALAAILVAPAARADDAHEHLEKGTRFYNLQDWSGALKEFKAAYEIDPKPEILWSIAQVQRLSGDCRSAIFTYKAYMRGASAAGANAAQEFVKSCQATLAAQRSAVEAPPPAEPPPQPRAETKPPPEAPPPQPVQPAQPKPASPWALDPLGDVLFVFGVGGLAVGATFLVVGNSDMSASSQKPTYQEYDHAVDVARTEQEVGVGSLIGGAVFAGLAIWRFVAVANRHAREHAAAFLVVPQPGGGFASMTLGF